MAIKTTRWRPDHCACILEYTWDDSLPQQSRAHTVSTFINTCVSHNIIGTVSTRWTAVLEENQRKNIALQVALDNGPTTLYDLSGTTRTLKPTITYNAVWSGTAPNRVVTISFTGITLTSTQKTTIRNALNTRFGTGPVLIP